MDKGGTTAGGMDVQRIAILGCGGSGKSTLARDLGRTLNLPVVHLDAHFWQPGWIETPRVDWVARVRDLAAADHWIIDGNYSGTFESRLTRADTVVFLDLPRRICLYRIIKRRIQYAGMNRPDMGQGCPEHIDLTFFQWIWNFPRRRRPHVLAALLRLPGSTRIFRLRSSRDVTAFLQGVQDGFQLQDH